MKLDARSPVCKPLYTYEEVVSWQPGNEDLNTTKIPRSPRQRVRGTKMLICHDMRGGYLEDRLLQGCPKSDCYRFYHWQYVDTFVYFSHHFVTIPPPTWIIPAHKHGVRVLGTLITEWDDGKRRCEAVLQSEETYKNFADKLVQIADFYGFDGWLVNIENPVKRGIKPSCRLDGYFKNILLQDWDDVQKLQGFVGYLTEQQHRYDPTSEVIWYDSVINTGQLKWQDELNEKNRLFFDVCDGIFLNYCWKDESLARSRDMAISAGRQYDVYVGVDVFGRGCLGGGGYNTCEALAAINNHDLSVALFANGWVYEKGGEASFVQNENKFWMCLDEFCFPRQISVLPLVTTFCQGQGQQYWAEGKVMMGSWYNQSVQQVQLSYTAAQFAKEDLAPLSPVMEHYMQEAFAGGNCIKLGGKLAKGQSLSFKLFSLDVDLNRYCNVVPEGITVLYVSFTYKCKQNEDSSLGLQLFLNRQSASSGKKAKRNAVLFLTTTKDCVPTKVADNKDVIVICDKVSDVPQYIRNTDSSHWKTCYFEIQQEAMKDTVLTELTAVLTSHSKEAQSTTVLLGEIRVIPVESIANDFPSLMFGDTSYHGSQSPALYINAENNDVERGIVNTENETEEANVGKEVEGLCDTTQIPNASKVQPSSITDIGQKPNSDIPPMKSVDTVQMQSLDTVPLKSFDTVQMQSQDSFHLKYVNTVRMTSTDTLNMPRSETILMTDSDRVNCQRSETVHMAQGYSVNYPRSETIQMADCDNINMLKCMECFTVHWRVPNPENVQYYRVYQVMRPSDELKLLGLTVITSFRVTGFELTPADLSKCKTELNIRGGNIANVNTCTEVRFECVVQPVLKTGNAVPLPVCKSNIKAENFGLENILDF